MLFQKFIDPKTDFAFKMIFGSEKNRDVLIHFLNDMIKFPEGKKVQTVTFLKPSQDPTMLAKKQSIVDVLCTDETGVQYIVEMQVGRSEGYAKRAQYYAARVHSNQMRQGEQYENLKETIFLAVTNFIMFPNSKYRSEHALLDIESYDHYLQDFHFCFLELPKFTKTFEELTNNVERWAYFFKHAPDTSSEELEKIAADYPIMRQAYHALAQFSWTEEENLLFEADRKNELDYQATLLTAKREGLAEGEILGLEKGEAIGLEKGEILGLEKGEAIGLKKGEEKQKQALVEIAKQMIAEGMSLSMIQKILKLSDEEMESIEVLVNSTEAS